MIEDKFSISPQHPSLAGHFPGNPLVPGVVILDEVIRSIRRHLGDVEVVAIPAVKFLSPLSPGQEVDLSVQQKKAELLSFTCRVADRLICNGQVRINV